MTGLALAERLDMPRLASDIRTTLVGLETQGRPVRVPDRGAAARRSTARPRPAPPPPSCAPCSSWATTTSTSAEFEEADAAFTRNTDAREGRGHPLGPLRRRGALDPRGVAAACRGGGTTRLRVLDTTKEVVPPIYDALLAGTRAQILVARGDPAGVELAHSLRPVLARGGSGRDHRRIRRDRGRRAGAATRAPPPSSTALISTCSPASGTRSSRPGSGWPRPRSAPSPRVPRAGARPSGWPTRRWSRRLVDDAPRGARAPYRQDRHLVGAGEPGLGGAGRG